MAIIENPTSPLIQKLEGLHLFHYDGAPCAQRVRFALHEKGLVRGREVKFNDDDQKTLIAGAGEWISRSVSLPKKEHMTKSYSEIQPNLVVPALVHNGVLHIESMDIVNYIDEVFGGTPLIPRHNKEQMLDAQELTNLGKKLHRSVRFVTYRWGLRSLARLSNKEEKKLQALLTDKQDEEQLVSFYGGYSNSTIPDAVYEDHLDQLNSAFIDLEKRLMLDGRAFLTGDELTMADVIWAMKMQRLIECDYPFEQCFPALYSWFKRISSRPSFREGVMGKYRFMSKMFIAKAGLERVLGIGLKREVLKRVA